jgi:uncharacterized membrane protein YbhN (UPF0104 family)
MIIKGKLIKTVFGWIVAIAIIYILFRTIYNNRAQLSEWEWRINWFQAVLSAFFLGLAYLCGSQGWRAILYGFGHKIRLYEAFRVIYLANLGRYIPGKVWQVIGLVGLAKEINISPTISMASFALVEAYALPASFILIPLSLGFEQTASALMLFRDALYIFMGITTLIFLILFFRPDGLEWALNKVLKLFRREPVKYKPSMKNRVAIFAWYILNWTFFGISFHFFLKALLADMPLPVYQTGGIYISAYVLSYITFISPAGLGVREGIMSALLAPQFGAPVAASIALINRVWITMAEVVITLLALATYKIKRDIRNDGEI